MKINMYIFFFRVDGSKNKYNNFTKVDLKKKKKKKKKKERRERKRGAKAEEKALFFRFNQ